MCNSSKMLNFDRSKKNPPKSQRQSDFYMMSFILLRNFFQYFIFIEKICTTTAIKSSKHTPNNVTYACVRECSVACIVCVLCVYI